MISPPEVILDTMPGTEIHEAVEYAIWFSKIINRNVFLVFNDTKLGITPTSVKNDVFIQFHEKRMAEK